jgi:hypothetical protein
MTPILGPCGCSELASFGDSPSDLPAPRVPVLGTVYPASAAHAVLGHAMVEASAHSGSKADLRPSLFKVTSIV